MKKNHGPIDAEAIRELAHLLTETGLTEIEIEQGGQRVRVARMGAPAAAHAVACSGPFAKDSSNLGLAMAFDSRNITFTEVDVAGSKVGATIVFPKDPKRRLEVW